MFYSKTTGGFYSTEIHGENIPIDAIEISVEYYTILINGQSDGGTIVADANGYPILEHSQLPPWSPDSTLEKVREAREVVLNRLSGIAFAALINSEQQTIDACLAARTSLLDITALEEVKAAKDDASLVMALKTAYANIVAAAPSSLVAAFRDFRL